MVHGLEMPDPFSGAGIEREQRIGKEVGADTIAAIEVGSRRAGRYEDDAPFRIEGHSRPRIRAAGGLPCAVRPGVVPEFAWPRNGMKGPANAAAVDVVRPHVTRGGAFAFSDACTLNEQILVNDPRTRRDEIRAGYVAAEA